MKTCRAIQSYLVPAALIFGFLLCGSAILAENLTVTLEAGAYDIVNDGNGKQIVEMDDFGNLLVPGKPMLPAKTFLIALPPGAVVSSVTTYAPSSYPIDGQFTIKPASAVLPNLERETAFREAFELWQTNNEITYASDEAYPPEHGRYWGTGGLRTYRFARVAYAPFTYHPQSGRLIFSPTLDVSIDYSVAAGEPITPAALADTKGDRLASRLFVNYPQASAWYRSPALLRAPQGIAEYVIVTTDALAGSVASLVAWKESLGYTVDVVTTSWISGTYTGMDLPERIRNFLIDNYIDWGIEYVLIVGDVADIPMRLCFPNPANHQPYSDYCPPTDYYYAELTSDWDSDGDGFPGEYGEDDIDFIPEVIVGRLPFSDPSTVSAVCDKLVAFEGDDGSWKDNALLAGAMSNYYNENYGGLPRTDGAELMEEMIPDMLTGWTYTRMYEKAGLNPSPYANDLALTYPNFVDTWSAGDFGVVNWWAHGSTDGAWRKWWDYDDGDGVPEALEINWEVFFDNFNAAELDDGHPSIIFSCACNNAWPEVDNLARDVLEHGSAGIVAATRLSWFNEGWTNESSGGNASVDYFFFHYLINENEKVGDALFSSKVYYLNHLYWSFADPIWTPQQNMLSFNLFGDPALARKNTCVCGVWGDVDGDGLVNPVDVVYMVNYVYKDQDARIQPPNCPYEAGDVDCTHTVNPVDVVFFVNYVYKDQNAFCDPCE